MRYAAYGSIRVIAAISPSFHRVDGDNPLTLSSKAEDFLAHHHVSDGYLMHHLDCADASIQHRAEDPSQVRPAHTDRSMRKLFDGDVFRHEPRGNLRGCVD